MDKAERRIRKYQSQSSQLDPFKNRKSYDFSEVIEHSRNQIKFIKILNKKRK